VAATPTAPVAATPTGQVAAALTGRLAVALACIAALAGCTLSSPSSSQPAAPSSSASASSPAASGSGTTPGTAPASSAPAAPASSAPAAPASSASPAVAAPPACPTSSLRVKLGVAQGYAGGVYQVIDFTNASGASCTLYGYPGASLVSAPPYAQIGLAATRASTAPVKLITLAPGATANAQLQIVDALNFPTGTCSPVKAAYLRVYPPNQRVSVYLPNTPETCSKPVQTLSISAVQAGSGGSS